VKAIEAVLGAPAHTSAATVASLARLEIRRTARNPVLWLGAVAFGGLTSGRWISGEEPRTAWATENYELWDWPAAILYLAAFLVGNVVALRERPSTTAELFVNTPASRLDRTSAVLAAAIVPAALALVACTVYLVLVIRAGGITVGDEPYAVVWRPTVVEVLAVPVTAALAWVAGVAMARTIGSRSVGVVVGFIGGYLIAVVWLWYWFPGILMAVIRTSIVWHDLGSRPTAAELEQWPAVDLADENDPRTIGLERDIPLFAGHVGFLIGLAVLLAGWALVRSAPDRRGWSLLATGVLLVLAALVAQLIAYDLPFEFGEVVP
jgi:hypothetical protein